MRDRDEEQRGELVRLRRENERLHKILTEVRTLLSKIDYIVDNAHHYGCEEALMLVEYEIKNVTYTNLCEFLDKHKSTDMMHKQATAVDLYALVGKGIDCSRFDADGYEPLNDEWYEIDLADLGVRPRTNYWFSALQFDDDWDMLKRLQDAGFKVEDKWDDQWMTWMGFRITGLQDGYCWPWELEGTQ